MCDDFCYLECSIVLKMYFLMTVQAIELTFQPINVSKIYFILERKCEGNTQAFAV